MTSDELLKRLEDRRVCSLAHNSCRNDWTMQEADARIRELEAERDEAVTQMIEAKVLNRGVADGTHVIVPVEPTEAMKRAALDYTDMPLKCWQAYLRAAQPDKPQ